MQVKFWSYVTPNFAYANITNVSWNYSELFSKFFVGDVGRTTLDTFNIRSTQLASRMFVKHWMVCTLAFANSGSANFGLMLV